MFICIWKSLTYVIFVLKTNVTQAKTSSEQPLSHGFGVRLCNTSIGNMMRDPNRQAVVWKNLPEASLKLLSKNRQLQIHQSDRSEREGPSRAACRNFRGSKLGAAMLRFRFSAPQRIMHWCPIIIGWEWGVRLGGRVVCVCVLCVVCVAFRCLFIYDYICQ